MTDMPVTPDQASYLLAPAQVLGAEHRTLGTLLVVRVLAPFLWVMILQGIGHWVIRSSARRDASDSWERISESLLQVMAGAVITVVPFHLAEWLGQKVDPNWAYLWLALGAAGLLSQLWTRLRPRGHGFQRILGAAACVWFWVVLTEARTSLPVFGDPLAFLVQAKQFLRSGFLLESLDPRQQLYPDLLIHQMAFFSAVFKQDPTAALMALAPISVAGLVLAWFLWCSSWIRNLASSGGHRLLGFGLGLGLALFALMAARNPLRFGLVAGRYPYLLGCMGLLVLLHQAGRIRKEIGPWAIGLRMAFGLAFVFLSHSSLVPLMLVPAVAIALKSMRAAWIAGCVSLALVAPRLLTMIPLMVRVADGPETQMPGGSLWEAIAVSPVCQLAFIAAATTWALTLVRSALNRQIQWGSEEVLVLGFCGWAWVAGSGLFEAMGLRGSLSHYGHRGYGLVVAMVMVIGMWRAAEFLRSLSAPWTRWLTRSAGVLMALHALAYGRMFWKERREPGARAESFRVLQRFMDAGAAPGSREVKGLIPAATLNGVIPFALTFGDVEYFPYFFPDSKMLVSFVPIRGFSRSNPAHVDLYSRWLAEPGDPGVVRELEKLGLDTVWLPDEEPFRSTIAKIEAAPDLYRPWFSEGKQRIYGVRHLLLKRRVKMSSS